MIKLFRSFLVVISFFIFGIGTFILGFIIFPMVKLFAREKSEARKTYMNLVHKLWAFFIAYLQTISVFKLKIEDIEKLKNIKNSIIVSTHPSFIDSVILIALIPNTTCFVAEKVSKNFLFRNIVNSIFLSSNVSIEEMQENTKSILDEGFNVLIFPSGIRHRKNEYPKFKKGASLIAINSQKNIVPISMYSDMDFLQINQPFYDAGDKTVNFYISALDEIDTKSFIEKYPDSVDCKKELTKRISLSLYKN